MTRATRSMRPSSRPSSAGAPHENFDTGIEKTVRWYLDNEWWWQPLRERYAGERLGLLESDATADGMRIARHWPRRAGRAFARRARRSRGHEFSRSGARARSRGDAATIDARDRGDPRPTCSCPPPPIPRSIRPKASPISHSRSTRAERAPSPGRAAPRRSADPSFDRLCFRRRNTALHRKRPDRAGRRLWRVKLAGERAVAREQDNRAILRTAWVYSPFGANFVKTMLRLATDRGEVSVVADQRGNPTSALDIAAAILSVAGAVERDGRGAARHLPHDGPRRRQLGRVSPKRSLRRRQQRADRSRRVNPIATADYPTAARRPANSRLDSAKLSNAYGLRCPSGTSTKLVVKRLLRSRRVRSFGG